MVSGRRHIKCKLNRINKEILIREDVDWTCSLFFVCFSKSLLILYSTVQGLYKDGKRGFGTRVLSVGDGTSSRVG